MYFFIMAALVSFNLNAQKMWNFSEDIWEAKDYTEKTVIDGLTINAASGKTISIDANNKSIDGYSFTKRLKLGGAGTATDEGRNVSFDVTGDCKITVYGMASSSGATDRSLVISDGTNELYKEIMLGDVIYKHEFAYTGGATTIYIYSSSSGLNFYGIKLDVITAISAPAAEKAVQSVEYYDLTGRKVINGNAVKGAVLIKKTTYADGSVSTEKQIKTLN
ncbi:MAG: hypothetical protein LBR64_09910 [Dysgonamonadaceae bacterium]|nr:hypothetical protein [Dysgonamonadaceae bacterium]